jgi:NADPH-dependent ferric siderophore reductase
MASVKMLLGSTLGRLVFTRLTVTTNVELAPHFRQVTVRGLAAAKPGDKVQLLFDGGLRTYTPWGQAESTTNFVVYLHDRHSTDQWRALAEGSELQGFGPRSSISFEGLSGRTIVIGDETSLGVFRSAKGPDVYGVFLVRDPEETTEVLAGLGLSQRTVLERRALDAAVASVRALEAPGATVVLTGHAQTIAALRAKLKAAGSVSGQRVKAYWADGKRGLD